MIYEHVSGGPRLKPSFDFNKPLPPEAQLKADAKREFWHAEYTRRAETDPREASARIGYKDEDIEALCQDAITALELGPKDILLDIGCAKGLMRPGLERTVLAYVGMDIVEAFRPDVVGDAVHLPFRDRAFDKVLLSGVLLLVPEEFHWLTLAEMWRVAKPGARGFVSANPFNCMHKHASVFERQSLCALACSAGWAHAFAREINPKLEQAANYFDMVVIRD